MEIPVHNRILWYACELAQQRGGLIDDPRKYFPLMARGSFILDYRQASIVFDIIEKKGPSREVRGLLAALWQAERARILESMVKTWRAAGGRLRRRCAAREGHGARRLRRL